MKKKINKNQEVKVGPQYGYLPPMSYKPIARLRQRAGLSTEYLKECAKAHNTTLSDIRKTITSL